MTTALARPLAMDLETFARVVRLHPDGVRRLCALGLLEPLGRDAAGGLWFGFHHVTAVARIQRLRASFSINYAALGLVIDLLDRVAELEAAQATQAGHPPRRDAGTSD
ncbi:hypothetical protein BJY21_003303 [Kineosphaera limosa]|uniref:MerR family transcriptional regulator n=1 Tax=Kineosphaera limosa NBRC 100340 TaxID=1184609 RepID=K6W7V6_9MICO|nr:chaperone modulator CbpM [Kineosphaera limosa]NYE02119.1 hypothetical protein [Kineosphaera limosa]GAB95280.1 hypothetical protein KILIM_018_00270 [Kineosphaera limosa NBRC 100340]